MSTKISVVNGIKMCNAPTPPLFNRDAKLKIGILTATGVAAAGLALAVGLRFPWSDSFAPLAVAATLGPCAAFYHRRRTAQFVSTLLAVMQLLLFTACFTMLMYSVAALSAPLQDGVFASVDSAMGIYVPDIVDWSRANPVVNLVITLAYNSVLPQTLLLVLLLGFCGDSKPLEQFVLRFMVALLITAAIFSVVPAEGPFALFHLEMNDTQQSYLSQLRQLRSGRMSSISLSQTEGLITFPSFHTTWAILLVCAVAHRRKLFVGLLLLNALVIAGTLTTGWHYFVDVLAGVAVAAITVALTNRIRPWLDATTFRGKK